MKSAVTTTAATTTSPQPMEEKRDGDGAGGGAGVTSKTAACGETATVVPASVAAARALFSSMGGEATDRQIKAALFSAAAQVLGGAIVLDKATVIAEGMSKRTQMMEMGREWPNDEFGGLLSAIADAE